MDGHVVKRAIFHVFSKLFRRATWELKAAVLRNAVFVLVFVASGSPAPTRAYPRPKTLTLILGALPFAKGEGARSLSLIHI